MTDAGSDKHSCRGGHGPLAEHRAADLICLDHVSYRYPAPSALDGDSAGRLALDDVTLHVERGCNLGIIGPNGAGKTTLLRILLGQIADYTGQARIAGLTPPEACRRGDLLGYVPQRHDIERHLPLTARQVARMGLVGKTGLFRRLRRVDKSYVDHLLEQVGIARLAEAPVGSLSGGQLQRLFIARALAPQPPILVLDEPLVGVDEAGQQQFAELIHQLHQQLALTVIIVSHDIQAIATGCNRVACLKQSIHYHDSPAGLTPEVLREVFEHEIRPLH